MQRPLKYDRLPEREDGFAMSSVDVAGDAAATAGGNVAGVVLAPEDGARADLYDLLAALLRSPPSADMLAALAALSGDGSPLGQAVEALAHIASRTSVDAARNEYHDLFIGIGRGELVPYGSYYLTGFLHEKPLGELRREMRARGMARSSKVREPEDHIAALAEMMAGMIRGTLGTDASLGAQRAFFDKHVGSWAPHFFRDLEAAPSAVLYAPIGTLGRVMMDVEASAFAME